MANFNELKAAVNAVIKQNGNEEITGNVLQNTLDTIISTVGKNRTFVGIATPSTNPGTPDANVFYLATEPGIYPNFSGIEVTEGVVILTNNASNTWIAQTTNIAINSNTFSGYVSYNVNDAAYIDNLKSSGLYIKKSQTQTASEYILHVRNMGEIIYQMRIYFSDWQQLIYALRSFNTNTQVWSAWSNARLLDSITDKDVILGSFNVLTTNDPNADNYIDKVRTSGLWVRYTKTGGNPVIYFIKPIGGVWYQTQMYYNDSAKFVFRERTYNNDTNTWSAWTERFFKYEDNTFDFVGFIDRSNVNAANYEDKVLTPGMYTTVKNSLTPFIYWVSNKSGVIYQSRVYFTDGFQFNFQQRQYDNNTQMWTDWIQSSFVQSVQLFKANNIDTIKSNGVYYNSQSPSIDTTGMLFVHPSTIAEYNKTQTLIQTDKFNNTVFKQRHWSNLESNWTDWGTNRLDAMELAQLVGKDAVAFDYSSYPRVDGKFIRVFTKELADNVNYSYVVIPLSAFNSKMLFITTAYQGGGILPISFWSSDDVNNPDNFVSRSSFTTYNHANGAYVENFPVSLSVVPSNATHLVVCWSKSEYPNMQIKQYNPDLIRQFDNVINRTSWFLGQREYVLGNNSLLQYKRGVAMNIGDYNPLIFVAGQSNADGRGDKVNAPQWLVDMNYKIDNYMMWNRIAGKFQAWELGVNTGSYENNKNQFGFDIFFAKKWLDANPGKKLYAIKETEGGIPIGYQRAVDEKRSACWSPEIEKIPNGENSMCEQMIERIHKAFAYAKQNGILLLPQCILWHQGEADMTDIRRPVFKTNLELLLGWLRGIFGSPAMPIINGQISDYYVTTYPTDNANIVFSEINNIDSYFKTVSMAGQPTVDGVHFTEAAYEYLGNAMYDYYKQFMW
jgi:hypothetical protein